MDIYLEIDVYYILLEYCEDSMHCDMSITFTLTEVFKCWFQNCMYIKSILSKPLQKL